MILIEPIQPKDTLLIRKQILRDNKALPCEFQGDFDLDTFHLGAFYEKKLVGIASFMKQSVNFLNGSQYQLRGMATLPEVRGLGYGKELIHQGIVQLQDKNIKYLWCNAREVAIKFYEKLGFTIHGKPFNIEHAGIHYKMYIKIK